MKMDSLGSWFDRLTTSGWDPVRPEAVEGRTGYFQGSEAGIRVWQLPGIFVPGDEAPAGGPVAGHSETPPARR